MPRRNLCPRRNPRIEVLEARELLATFVVSSTADAGAGSLRQAILDANADGDAQSAIRFAIGSPGVQTIAPATVLPTITRPVVVDGTTQPGYDPASGPLVAIDGSAAGGVAGLTLTGGSTVRGLAIVGFSFPNSVDPAQGAGILLVGATGGNRIEGNYLGIRPDGASAGVNFHGIEVASPGNTIGGTSPATRNVISNSRQAGVYVRGLAASDNLIQGNSIGTDAAGTASRRNSFQGILLSAEDSAQADLVTRVTIGGTAPGAGNLISANREGIAGRVSGGLIVGNTIGLDASGTRALGNDTGIRLLAIGTTIGGTTAAARNVISGNVRPGGGGIGQDVSGYGIDLRGDFNSIQGNFIGPDSTGNAAVETILGTDRFTLEIRRGRGNYNGVRIDGTRNTVGGATAGAGNVISGNNEDGLSLLPGGNLVQGNRIGADNAASPGPFTNGGHAVLANIDISAIGDPSRLAANTIGGTAPGAGNTILSDPAPNTFFTSPSEAIRVAAGSANITQSLTVLGNTIGGEFLRPNLGGASQLISAVPTGSALTVTGVLTGTPGATYLVEVFANPASDPGGQARGRAPLGTIAATVDGTGVARFRGPVASPSYSSPVLSTTVTGPTGDTSGSTADFPTPAGPAVADLAIVANATPGPVPAGNDATITFTVTNNGPDAARGLIFGAALPAGLADASAIVVPTPGPASLPGQVGGTAEVQPGGLVRATINYLAPGESVVVTIFARATRAGTFAITGGASGGQVNGPNLADNEATATVTVAAPGASTDSADLTISTPFQGYPVFVFGPVDIPLTVTNHGPTDATNVVVRNVLGPAGDVGLTVPRVIPSQGSVRSISGTESYGYLYTIDLGTIPAGGSATIRITASGAVITAPIINTARVSSDQSDPAPLDNSSRVRLSYIPAPFPLDKLTIAPSGPASDPVVGSEYTFGFDVAYSGTSRADSLNVIEALPRGVTFVRAESSQGTVARFDPATRTVSFALDPIPGGGLATFRIVIRPDLPGPIAATAILTGNDPSQVIASLTQTATVRPAVTPPTPAVDQPPADFDSDGRSDLAVYLTPFGAFAYRPSAGGPDVIVPFGIAGPGRTLPAAGDYTGSGRSEVAAYLPDFGAFAIRPAGGGPDVFVPFGLAGAGQSLPAPADFDGDGRVDLALYLPALGAFAYRPSGGNPDQIIPFGLAGAGQSLPAPGDYDGDGRADLAAYLPTFGFFAYRPSGGGPDAVVPFGIAGAGQTVPIAGDFDGDGRSDLAVYFPALGTFAYRPSGGGADVLAAFGVAGDGSIPVPGDYSGSGRSEIAVFNPNFAAFAYRPAGGGPDVIVPFGLAGIGQSVPVTSPGSSAVGATAGVRAAAVAPASTGSRVPAGPAPLARRALRKPVAQANPDLFKTRA